MGREHDAHACGSRDLASPAGVVGLGCHECQSAAILRIVAGCAANGIQTDTSHARVHSNHMPKITKTCRKNYAESPPSNCLVVPLPTGSVLWDTTQFCNPLAEKRRPESTLVPGLPSIKPEAANRLPSGVESEPRSQAPQSPRGQPL